MNYKFISTLLIVFVAAFQHLHAQKFGHINSAVIIENHPRVVEANAQLENFQKMLADSFSIKVKAFETKYLAFLEESSGGTLSQVTAASKQNELKAEQQTLATEEQQLQFRLLQKREELLKPILTDVDSLIQAIGKEGNYSMIFDTSVSGALLYAVESEDLTDIVKGKCMAKQ